MFRASLAKSRRSLTPSAKTARYLHVYGAPIDIHPEVQEALGAKKPVVALETTLITSGLPRPINLQVGNELEKVVRQTGSVPASIGIIGGRVKIGLEPHEMERLANGGAAKVSRRDIAPVIASKGDGGTTCSATLIFAALAGIKEGLSVFATGGLGGVHRGGESTMDISADLQELTRCPVGLVSAGVKSILDIGRTLEYLETLGVPVLPYGTNKFPAFFTRRSGYKLPWKVDDAAMAAQILHTQKLLNMSMGALFAAPIPEEYEAAGAEIQKAVDQAVRESEENGMSKRGKEVTPWLLKRVGELTGGSSIDSNIALLRNTAFIGGQIAVEYSKLVSESNHLNTNVLPTHDALKKNTPVVEKPVNVKPPKADVIVAGAAAVDITAQVSSNDHGKQSTSPGTVSISLGGVGRNIAEAAHRASAGLHGEKKGSVLLVSAIGNDPFARLLSDEMTRLDMRTDGLVSMDGNKTAVCNMLLNAEGDLMNGVAAMDVVEQLPGDKILTYIDENTPSIVCLDGNLSSDNIKHVVNHCNNNDRSSVIFEPTSVTKSARIIPAIASSLRHIDSSRSCIAFSTPNLLELKHIFQCCSDNDLTSTTEWWNIIDAFSLGGGIRNELELLSRLPVSEEDSTKGTLGFLLTEGLAQMAINLLPFFQHLLIKCGPAGVFLVMRVPSQDATKSAWDKESSNIRARRVVSKGPSGEIVILQHLPPLPINPGYIINVTGAGDSFVGSILATLSSYGSKAFQNPSLAMKVLEEAQQAAVLTLGSEASVSPLIGQRRNV